MKIEVLNRVVVSQCDVSVQADLLVMWQIRSQSNINLDIMVPFRENYVGISAVNNTSVALDDRHIKALKVKDV